MATVTWIGLGQMGQPMVTDLGAAGQSVRGLEIVSDAEVALLVRGMR